MELEVRASLTPKNGASAPICHLAETARPSPSAAQLLPLIPEASVLPLKIRQYSQSEETSTLLGPSDLEFLRVEGNNRLKMSKNPRPTRTLARYDPLPRRIGDLTQERAKLEEEILQLRAALQIWTEVCLRSTSTAAGSQALNAEMR
jgi:hypothetical protein